MRVQRAIPAALTSASRVHPPDVSLEKRASFVFVCRLRDRGLPTPEQTRLIQMRRSGCSISHPLGRKGIHFSIKESDSGGG